MNVRDDQFNYLTNDNNTKIIKCSSYDKQCEAKNVIIQSSKTVWVSMKGLPQFITFDIANIIKKPNGFFKYWGIYCLHSYLTNPKEIEIQYSNDNNKFVSLGKYYPLCKRGVQIFEIQKSKIPQKEAMAKFIKIIIHKTYGGNRTYLNQVLFYDDQNDTMEPNTNSVNKAQSINRIKINNFFKKNIIVGTDKSKGNQLDKKKEIKLNKIIEPKGQHNNFNTSRGDLKRLSIPNKILENSCNILGSQTSRGKKVPINLNNERARRGDKEKEIGEPSQRKIIGKIYNDKESETKSFYLENQRGISPSESSIKQNLFSFPNSPTVYANNKHYKNLEKQLNELDYQLNEMKVGFTKENLSYRSTKVPYSSQNIYASFDFTEKNLEKLRPEELSDSKSMISMRINGIEEKVLSMEKKIGLLKSDISSLSGDIEKNMKESYNTQSKKQNKDEDTIRPTNMKLFKKDLNQSRISLSNEYNINQKFDQYINSIEKKIYDNYINPSISSFETKMKERINEMKNIISGITKSHSSSLKYNLYNNTSVESAVTNSSVSSHINNRGISDPKSNNKSKYNNSYNQSKIEKVAQIGERLFEKLLEKKHKLEKSSLYMKQLLQKEKKEEEDE